MKGKVGVCALACFSFCLATSMANATGFTLTINVVGGGIVTTASRVHRAYAKRTLVKIPSLQEFEQRAASKA